MSVRPRTKRARSSAAAWRRRPCRRTCGHEGQQRPSGAARRTFSKREPPDGELAALGRRALDRVDREARHRSLHLRVARARPSRAVDPATSAASMSTPAMGRPVAADCGRRSGRVAKLAPGGRHALDRALAHPDQAEIAVGDRGGLVRRLARWSPLLGDGDLFGGDAGEPLVQRRSPARRRKAPRRPRRVRLTPVELDIAAHLVDWRRRSRP